jgi:hypothetical protein
LWRVVVAADHPAQVLALEFAEVAAEPVGLELAPDYR